MQIVKKIKKKIYKMLHPAMGEVWMLHRVVSDRSVIPSQRDLEVTPCFLEEKIQKYLSNGYEFITMDEVVTLLNARWTIFSIIAELFLKKKRFVCITLDDGYQDNYEIAYPILKKYNIPFIIYVTTGFVDGGYKVWWYEEMPSMLTWDQLIELSKEPLCTIGAHTVSHPRLSALSKEAAYDEIMTSQRRLSGQLGQDVVHFSYPHGAYNEDVRQVVEESEMRSAVLVWGGYVRMGQSQFEIPRIPIVQE